MAIVSRYRLATPAQTGHAAYAAKFSIEEGIQKSTEKASLLRATAAKPILRWKHRTATSFHFAFPAYNEFIEAARIGYEAVRVEPAEGSLHGGGAHTGVLLAGVVET